MTPPATEGEEEGTHGEGEAPEGEGGQEPSQDGEEGAASREIWRDFPIDPETGYAIDPNTGAYVDPETGATLGGSFDRGISSGTEGGEGGNPAPSVSPLPSPSSGQ